MPASSWTWYSFTTFYCTDHWEGLDIYNGSVKNKLAGKTGFNTVTSTDTFQLHMTCARRTRLWQQETAHSLVDRTSYKHTLTAVNTILDVVQVRQAAHDTWQKSINLSTTTAAAAAYIFLTPLPTNPKLQPNKSTNHTDCSFCNKKSLLFHNDGQTHTIKKTYVQINRLQTNKSRDWWNINVFNHTMHNHDNTNVCT
jgi:hypothetical protein